HSSQPKNITSVNTVFKDLKIIDLSSVLAGPSVGMFFAELGADVLKIEQPGHPDVTRSWKLPQEKETGAVSAYFSSVNYRKKYTSLNLKKKADYQTFLTQVESADVLLMNFKLGDQDKLQISDKILRESNPKLIIGKISGFGEDDNRVA